MDGINGPVQNNAPSQPEALPEPIVVPGRVISPEVTPAITPVDAVQQQTPASVPHRPRAWRRPLGIAMIAASVIAVAIFAFAHVTPKATSDQIDASQRFSGQTAPLPSLSAQLSSKAQGTDTLTVNGQLKVTGGVVLDASTQPVSPVAGQLYYDQTSNQVAYYNGLQFVKLQGGGSVTNVSNNVSNNNVTNNNVTNVTNVTQGGSGNVNAPNGTTGQLAMFTGPSVLGDSLITQNGSTLTTGSGQETVTIGSNSGTSTSTFQGGTGGVAINTGGASGSSGSITVQSGDSSTTASGNVSVDTGASVITGTVVDNKTFENGLDNMGDNIYSDNSTVTQTSAIAHSGTHSLSIAVGSNYFPNWGVGEGTGNPPIITPVTAGHTYAFSAWVRAATNSDTITATVVWSNDGYGGGGLVSQQTFGTVTDITTGWRKVAGVLTAPVSAVRVGFSFSSNDATTIGEVHYFDDLIATDLSSSSAASSLNLGATNAQVITIGNSGMLAATSIYGGGVNLNAGTGFLTLSGSNISATSGGATLTTTTGALDITAATSSTWKIAGSGGGGGNLSIESGNAGGNGNGGNLTLQSGSGSGTGAGGSVIVRPGTDSTAAFQVQNAAGDTTLLNVDTTANEISLGTGAGSSLGYTGTAGSTEGSAIPGGKLTAFKLTTTAAGTLKSMSVYAFSQDGAPNNLYQLAIYADNGGSPGAYLGSTAVGALNLGVQLYTLPLNAPVNVVASTPYWFVYWENGSDNTLMATSGTMSRASNQYTWQAGPDNGLPAAFPSPSLDSSSMYTIYATYSSSTPALTINSSGTLTQQGAALFQDPTDISTAFQVQSSSGTALLTADTSTMTVTVQALTVNTTLTVNGHIVTGGANPSVAAGVAACTAPTVSVSGTDTTGTITVTTGTGCGAPGKLATVTFATGFTTPPRVVLSPGSAATSGLAAYTDNATVSATTFDLDTSVTPSGTTTYTWNYWAAD